MRIDLREAVQWVTYRPGWVLKVREHKPVNFPLVGEITVEVPVKSVYPPYDQRTLIFSKNVTGSWFGEEDQVVRILYDLLWAAEQHEAQEHFLYKGGRVFDPHRYA